VQVIVSFFVFPCIFPVSFLPPFVLRTRALRFLPLDNDDGCLLTCVFSFAISYSLIEFFHLPDHVTKLRRQDDRPMNTILERAMMKTGITIHYIVNFIQGYIYLSTLLNQVSSLFLGNAHRPSIVNFGGVQVCGPQFWAGQNLGAESTDLLKVHPQATGLDPSIHP
jgi:hypothetical protein